MRLILNIFAKALEKSGDFRVLRRLRPQSHIVSGGASNPFIGIILDTETTGMTPGTNEVIELGMLKFEYSQDGRIYRVLDSFNALQQPRSPIPPHITAITGITDEERSPTG